MKSPIQNLDGAFHFIKTALSTIKEYLPPIVLRPHREVHPIRRTPLLQNQLVENPFGFIGDVEQDAGIPDHLLRAITSDIYRAAGQVITPLRPTALHIHLLTPIPRRNHDGDFPS